MKKFIVLCMALAFVATFSTASFAAISGGVHDLSSTNQSGSTNSDQICAFCHIPHNTKSVAGLPLWNRSASTKTFVAYGTTEAGTVISDIGAASKVCLSCHDGVTNVDAFGTSSGTVSMTGLGSTASAIIGLDLTEEHPVGVTATVDTNGMVSSFGSNVQFYSNKVECASCHDPHTTETSLLRASLDQSALCLECHNK